jgi:hypothetical protein
MVSTWSRRFVMAGCGAALGLAALAPVASADDTTPPPPPTQYAPTTLSPQETQQMCDQMLPKIDDRIAKATARINGGPEVKGSVAWLKAKAQDQRNKGHQQAAERLDKRADRRAGRVGDLTQLKQRAESFRTAHCQPAGGTK